MDGRLALSRRRQNGRVADQTLPVTERLLSRLPGPRAAWVLAWAAIPVAAGLLPSAYLATVGTRPLPVRLLIGLVFAYAVVLAYARNVRYFGRPGESTAAEIGIFALAPLYTLLHVVLLSPLRVWALLTLRRGTWGTRASVEVTL